APAGTPDLRAFEIERSGAQSVPRVLRLDCRRSPSCSPDHSNPEAELQDLILATRLHPIEGDAYDANGRLVHVRIDEKSILILSGSDPTGVFINNGEILAAARSLSQRDARPLLRLGAEAHLLLVKYPCDLRFLSGGAIYSTACVDLHHPWDWAAPVSTRQSQLSHAVSELLADYFAPFSKSAATSLLYSLLK